MAAKPMKRSTGQTHQNERDKALRERIIDDGGKHWKKERERNALSSRPLDLPPCLLYIPKKFKNGIPLLDARKEEEGGGVNLSAWMFPLFFLFFQGLKKGSEGWLKWKSSNGWHVFSRRAPTSHKEVMCTYLRMCDYKQDTERKRH